MNGKNKHITLEQVYDWNNLELAYKNARKGKSKHYGVRKFERDTLGNLTKIQTELQNGTFSLGKPKMEYRLCDRKMRMLAKITFDKHVAMHALMQICGPIIEKHVYIDASASIKKKGIHYTFKRLRNYIDIHKAQKLYWVQLDYKKCYHHINRAILYNKICKLFNDSGIRKFFYQVINALGNHNGLSKSDGTEGLGIGLYPVQLLVNFYFSDQDRHTAELGVRVFRYCDNTVILSLNIENLKKAIEYQKQSSKKLYAILHEQIGIQVLSQRNPIDFIGYKFYPDKILVRDDIKQRFKRKFKSTINISALGAYKGWLMHCNANRLWKCITGFNSYNYDTRK